MTLKRLVANVGLHGLKGPAVVFVVGVLGLVGYRAVSIGATPESWVAALDHEWPSIRREAHRRLVDVRGSAIAPIVDAIRQGTIDRADRAFLVLAELYLAGDPRLQDRVELELNALEFDDSPLTRGLVQGCYLKVRDERLRRIIDRCRAMGAIAPEPDELAGVLDPRPRKKMTLVLGPDWNGGEAGLELVRRMPRLRVLHVLPGAGVTDGQLDRLRAARPRLEIERRGAGCIGIAGSPRSNGFEILEVDDRSGARLAGLRPGDRVVRIDGAVITNGSSMFPPLANREPGDTVVIRVDRAGKLLDVEVVLGRDGARGECECDPLEALVDRLVEP